MKGERAGAAWAATGPWKILCFLLFAFTSLLQNRAMSSLVGVAIHASQFPENVRRDLLDSLRRRRVNHKFHYDSVKQTQKWLALHEAYSPARTDTDCRRIYDRSFAVAAEWSDQEIVDLLKGDVATQVHYQGILEVKCGV